MKILISSTGEAESKLAGQKNWSQEHTPAKPRDNNRGTDEDKTGVSIRETPKEVWLWYTPTDASTDILQSHVATFALT
ncbi:hypothetical protein G5714_004681 [Onychostoma macrolepis]|uniref:Uncharacterized protein n=1 Tax=Onychostoma macrolepis TaxID=369639 RepID=A0A7J6D5B7_9TELE|nr:hypothetical protein G5714_004681 [Onychostoma macrolepis]